MSRTCVLIPTYNRHAALAVTLTSLYYQDDDDFAVVIADQSDEPVDTARSPVCAAKRLLEQRGVTVSVLRNLPRQGLAQQRQFLLEHCRSRLCLFIDDDVILEPWVIRMLAGVIERERCGFAGNAVIGLSHVDDTRPHEQHIELWDGAVQPEHIRFGDPRWQRHRLHNAANLWHVQRRLGARPADPLLYKVAWVGGCIMYDTEKLRDAGGFEFWTQLPGTHCGEDVLAQLRVASRHGGCGVMPSGAYHQELETTVSDRRVDAPRLLDV